MVFSLWLDAHLVEIPLKRKKFHSVPPWLDAHLAELQMKRNN
jgi:hypothetical protein